MDRQTVMERKTRLLDGTVSEYPCTVLELVPGERAVLRYDVDREYKVGDLTIGPGAFTIGYYWTDRPYNVYHWLTADARTLAYYVNVADQTEIAPGVVAYRDLVVDVVLYPSGRIDVVDEDELPPDLDVAHRKAIAQTLEVLVTAGRTLARDIEKETRRWL